MQWFRLYDDVLDDPKVQQLKPDLFKHWINLLCLANKNDPRGYLPPEWKDIAFRLRVSPKKAVEIVRELVALELIDEGTVTFRPHNWDERQKRSDNVAARVAKHRSNVTDPLHETPEKRDSNVLDTDTEVDTDTDTDTEQKQSREELDPPVGPPSGDKPKPQRTIKTPIPDNLVELIPAEVWSTIGSEQQLTDEQLRYETDLMLDHFGKKGERMVDWVKAWRSWMRSEYRKSKPLPPEQPDPYEAWKNGGAAVAPELRRAS